MCTRQKHRYTQVRAGRNTPKHPHTCCLSSSTAPCVNGWESNYYSHTRTTFSTLVSQDMCACSCVYVCTSVSERAVGLAAVSTELSHTLLISRLLLISHRNTLDFIQNPVKHGAVLSWASKHVVAAWLCVHIFILRCSLFPLSPSALFSHRDSWRKEAERDDWCA